MKGIKDLIEKEKIDCCLKECTMSLYTDDLKNVGMLEKEQHYLHLFGETVFDNQKHLKTISLHHQYLSSFKISLSSCEMLSKEKCSIL